MQYNDQGRCISNIITRSVCIYHEGAETLAQFAQRSFGCPILKSVQDQVGWGSE